MTRQGIWIADVYTLQFEGATVSTKLPNVYVDEIEACVEDDGVFPLFSLHSHVEYCVDNNPLHAKVTAVNHIYEKPGLPSTTSTYDIVLENGSEKSKLYKGIPERSLRCFVHPKKNRDPSQSEKTLAKLQGSEAIFGYLSPDSLSSDPYIFDFYNFLAKKYVSNGNFAFDKIAAEWNRLVISQGSGIAQEDAEFSHEIIPGLTGVQSVVTVAIIKLLHAKMQANHNQLSTLGPTLHADAALKFSLRTTDAMHPSVATAGKNYLAMRSTVEQTLSQEDLLLLPTNTNTGHLTVPSTATALGTPIGTATIDQRLNNRRTG